MKAIGQLLGEASADDNVAPASVYLYRLNGTAMELLSYQNAEALLRRVSECRSALAGRMRRNRRPRSAAPSYCHARC